MRHGFAKCSGREVAGSRVNYFAHGREFLDSPYFLAGTAVPDWLNVVDRRMRVRGKTAARFVDHPDPRQAALAAGVVQHHEDDRWFHQTRAFVEMCARFSQQLRELLDDHGGFRPSFLGHILVELLLDAELIRDDPARVDTYYEVLGQTDPEFLGEGVNLMATRTSDRLAPLILLFCRERFLYDYGEDASLLRRLNHVMRRVELPQLPETLVEFFPGARQEVSRRRRELLQRPEAA
jgi:hypothetical protein